MSTSGGMSARPHRERFASVSLNMLRPGTYDSQSETGGILLMLFAALRWCRKMPC
jgi:hypothetical protein